MEITIPYNHKYIFEPQIAKIISTYAKRMTIRLILETIEDIYGFETSEGFISDVTDNLLL